MAKVYINDVLQTSPIKMVKSTQIAYDLPNACKNMYAISATNNNHDWIFVYDHDAETALVYNIRLDENGLPDSISTSPYPQGGHSESNVMYSDNNEHFRLNYLHGNYPSWNKPSSGTVTRYYPSLNLERPTSKWTIRCPQDGRIHFFGYGNKHYYYRYNSSSYEYNSVAVTDINLDTDKVAHFLIINNKLRAYCMDDNAQVGSKNFILECDTDTYTWTEVFRGSFIGCGNLADFRKQRMCVDSQGYIHRVGTYTGSLTAADYVSNVNMTSEVPNYLPKNYNPADIVATKGNIFVLGGTDLSTQEAMDDVYIISEDARNAIGNDWSSSNQTYQIVSSTVNLPNNQTITFDASGNVVNN